MSKIGREYARERTRSIKEMTDEIIKKAIEEVEHRNFDLTKQYLSVHSVTYQNGRPKVERVDTDSENDTVIVYFPIDNEDFFLAVYLDTEPEIEVRWITTEAGTRVYFRATSDIFTLDELMLMTKIKPTGGWNMGDWRTHNKSRYEFSSFEFEPNPERADNVEDKITKLLNHLDQDKEGIKKLSDSAHGHIQVCWYSHNGTGMLGGFHLDKKTIKRMAALGLEIDYDLYAGGQQIKS